jgi:hypothetical protein
MQQCGIIGIILCQQQRPGSHVEPKDVDLRLPSLHVSRCVQILKLFKKLGYLRLVLDAEILSTISCEDRKFDSGIRELSSLRGLQLVEVRGLNREPLESTFDCAKWLKETLENRNLIRNITK